MLTNNLGRLVPVEAFENAQAERMPYLKIHPVSIHTIKEESG